MPSFFQLPNLPNDNSCRRIKCKLQVSNAPFLHTHIKWAQLNLHVWELPCCKVYQVPVVGSLVPDSCDDVSRRTLALTVSNCTCVICYHRGSVLSRTSSAKGLYGLF